ncbi:MAG TPA: restriction endonuclease subunit S [Candidatus Paceibacterota bacterium]|nr:restriction endonuclease subunit S [Verrucomicrobiota bacterium]HRY47801.1 restriction endonuclease subunit S [Candidatus Paceibacterota bacterium]HSA00722.1 restriction endonuclease subunit S [Candidatus Paceibacterota bacterium]
MLGETCDILPGFGFPERLQGKVEGEIAFFKVGDISEAWKRGDVYLTKAHHYLSRVEAAAIRATPLPRDTIVFAKIGAAIALNRRAILSEPSLVDNNVMGLHPASDELDAKFLFHYACTLRLDELSRATTVPSVRKSDIEAIPIPVPPLPEQRRIVAEIEKQFTRLEAGVAALRRVQANLKRYCAAVLKAA